MGPLKNSKTLNKKNSLILTFERSLWPFAEINITGVILSQG